ncbi:MAG: hypothetical protein FD152_750 [Xanthobacteraceae bacterium]|nr:MAG: hypothetical protein FD152_750 [Xanthobacteraceae bacterium]
MTGPETRFDLHTVELICAREDLPAGVEDAATLDWLIGERRIETSGDLPKARLTVRPAGKEGLSLPAEMVEKPVAGDGRLRTGRAADGHHVLAMDEAACLALLPGGNSLLQAALPADRLRPALGDAMIFALDHALSSHGQCLAHAACLATPDGRGMVMLHAASGTGKTTTAMALALAGFRLSGDDTTALLAPAGSGRHLAWGLPRGAKVHRRTVDMLPALRDLVSDDAWDRHGEQMIGRATLHGAGFATRAGPLPVTGVVSLTHADEGAGPFAVQGAFDALDALMRDNISPHPDGFFPGHEARFDIFSSLVTVARCLRVPVRGHPSEVAATIAGALGY